MAMPKKPPSLEIDVLIYPEAVVLDQEQSDGSANVLATTMDDVGKVWDWYARRLGAGVSPIGVGHRDLDSGRLVLATRRTGRVLSPSAPFQANEHPQVLAVQQGNRALTVVISRGSEDDSTRIFVLLLVTA
jgi:hypothetical protein